MSCLMARILLKIDSGNDIGSKFKTVTFCSNAPASPGSNHIRAILHAKDFLSKRPSHTDLTE